MSIFQREPARVAGIITNFVTVLLALFVAFGVDVGEEVQKAILASILPTITFIQLMFELTRASVVPVKKAAQLQEIALETAPETMPATVSAIRSYDLAGARKAQGQESTQAAA